MDKELLVRPCVNCGTPINSVEYQTQPNTKRGYYFKIRPNKKFCDIDCYRHFHKHGDKSSD